MREKFLFMDVKGFAKAAAAGFQRKMEVVVFLDRTVPRVEEWIDRTTFRLGCTPIINLFEQVAEPIALDQGQYRISRRARRGESSRHGSLFDRRGD